MIGRYTMNDKDIDAHFHHQKNHVLATHYINGDEGLRKSAIQATYWYLNGPTTRATFYLSKFNQVESEDHNHFFSAYHLALEKGLVTLFNLDSDDAASKIFEITKDLDNPVLKYWCAGRLEEKGKHGKAAILLSQAITICSDEALSEHFLPCCYAAIIRLSEHVIFAKTIVAGLLFDDKFKQELLHFEVEIKKRNQLDNINDPYDIAEKLLFSAIQNREHPDPNAVLMLAKEYCSDRFDGDIDRSPEMAARILCNEYFKKTQAGDDLQYNSKAREAFCKALDDIITDFPDSPEINHYQAKIHLYLKRPDLAYACILKADKVLFVKPQLLYEIGCLIMSTATGEHRENRLIAANKIFNIAAERGSILSCQELAKHPSRKNNPEMLVSLHSRALLISYLLCHEELYLEELKQLKAVISEYAITNVDLNTHPDLEKFCNSQKLPCTIETLNLCDKVIENDIMAIRLYSKVKVFISLEPGNTDMDNLETLAKKGNVVAVATILKLFTNHPDAFKFANLIANHLSTENLIHYFRLANGNKVCDFLFDIFLRDDVLSSIPEQLKKLEIVIKIYASLLLINDKIQANKLDDAIRTLTSIRRNATEIFYAATTALEKLFILSPRQKTSIRKAERNVYNGTPSFSRHKKITTPSPRERTNSREDANSIRCSPRTNSVTKGFRFFEGRTSPDFIERVDQVASVSPIAKQEIEEILRRNGAPRGDSRTTEDDNSLANGTATAPIVYGFHPSNPEEK